MDGAYCIEGVVGFYPLHYAHQEGPPLLLGLLIRMQTLHLECNYIGLSLANWAVNHTGSLKHSDHCKKTLKKHEKERKNWQKLEKSLVSSSVSNDICQLGF